MDFGSLTFGTESALFNQVDAQVAGAGGITVLCSNGVTPTFTLLNGVNDGEVASGTHAMELSTGGEFIGYTLYTDEALSTPLTLNGDIALSEFTGSAETQSIELYGRAFGDAGSLPAGEYTDTLSVQLTW